MISIGEITGLRPRKPWHDGKHVHKSREAAAAQIRSMIKRGDREYEAALREGHTLQPYPCREGGTKHYHVGHNRRKRKQTSR